MVDMVESDENTGILYRLSKKRLHVSILCVLVLNIVFPILLRITAGVMYSFFITVYVWIAAYALLLFLLLKWERSVRKPLIQGPLYFAAVFVAMLIFRSAFLGLDTYISLDPLWYLDYGKFMQMGRVPFSEFYFPYPPFFAYVIYTVMLIAPAVDSFRIFAMVMDGAVAFLIWKLASNHMNETKASTALLAYAFLPISIIESGWNGHFEPLASAFMLIGLWFMLHRRQKLSAVFLALGAVTKIYPIVLLPFALFYIKGLRERFEFFFTATATAALSYLPFALHGLLNSGISGSGSTNPSNFLLSQFEFILDWSFPNILVSILAYVGVLIGVLLIVKELALGSARTSRSSYFWASVFVGIILIIMGFTAVYYPFSTFSKGVYWRYPVDIGIVRGVSSAAIGMVILFRSYRSWQSGTRQIHSTESTLFLYSGAILLLLSLSRDVFYGWYLLWSVPFFLLLKNRRLGLTIVLALLLVYPSYTHDNFSSVGYAEARLWDGRFQSSMQWSVFVNTSGVIDDDLIHASFAAKEDKGYFRFNTTAVTNRTLLSNVSIVYTRYVSFHFNDTVDFAARIYSKWNPTFGAYAFLSMKYEARNETGDQIEGTIIPASSQFTNLTTILWRYSFSSEYPSANATVYKLQVVIHPRVTVASEYVFEEMYTTYIGLLNPVYFLIIPSLIALSLVGFALVQEELRSSSDDEVMYTKDKKPTSSR